MTKFQGWFLGRDRAVSRATLLLLSSFAVFSGCGNKGRSDGDGAIDMRDWASTRAFSDGRYDYAPADLQRMSLRIAFDIPRRRATGTATIRFRATRDGRAYFLSEPQLLNVTLDGNPVAIETVRDPDNLNDLRVVASELAAGSEHELRVEYQMPSNRMTITSTGVGFLTTMSDITRGNYFEAYAPANFEDDAYELSLRLELVGASSAHRLFSNGEATKIGDTAWNIAFPAYFVASSFYVHLTEAALVARTSSYASASGRTIPLTVYARDGAAAQSGIDMLPGLFGELEATFGPYAHSSFTAYISGSGGMEHVGATITSLSALGHELTHSWFARGVMPSDGRSGWIDEAIASWRDYGFFRATSVGDRPATNLGRFSAFHRFAPANSYADGRRLLSELDFLFAGQGGLRPILREFFARHQRRSIRNSDFRSVLESQSQLNLGSLFQTYVFGNDSSFEDKALARENTEMPSLHPPLLTEAEIRALR